MGRKAKAGCDGSDASTGGLKPRRQSTPEERRAAVEAYLRSGLTRGVFARQWGVTAWTLGAWLKRYGEAGPKGLERLAAGPAKRRGRAPLPEGAKAEIEAAQRAHASFGIKKLKDWLWRFAGLRASRSSVRRVVVASGLARAAAVPAKGKAGQRPPRRFERARPGELWQSDITYLRVPWSRHPLYLIAFVDDHSRYVVGFGLYPHQRAEIALETFQEAVARYGKPKEVLTDQGRQYFAWRGKSAFQRLLAREGVRHVVARAQHPETVGKCERLWATVKTELWERVHPRDLEEARERLRQFFAHHNFQRPHQSLEGLVPADRFFGVESEVRRAIEGTVAKNALRLALGEPVRRPVFLVGQIDGKAVSVHGEAGRIVVRTPDGAVQEIATKDLGMGPGRSAKEVEDGTAGEGGGDDGDERGGDGGRGGDGARAGGGDDAGADGASAAVEPEADAVPGAQAGAGAGAGAVEERERGGAEDGAPEGDGGAAGVAGRGEP